jgi:hypothetical protein
MIVERKKKILDLLLSAGTLKHSQICELLEPWYEEVASFGASVSNILGQLRLEGKVIMKKRPTGRTIFVRQYGYMRLLETFWSVNPASLK